MAQRRRRSYIQAEQDGFTFRFYADEGGELHITNRHGTTMETAIDTFFAGEYAEDPEHQRYVTETATHVLLWAWYANRPEDHEVMIISCYTKE